VFSFANPQAALEAMWETHPETKPPAGLRNAVLRHDMEVLKACLEPMRIDKQDPDSRWCAIPAEEMIAWQDFLLRSGVLHRKLDLKRLYTMALVARINNFNAEEILAAAHLSIPRTGNT
jgi:NitT/TauT family transport system substrate-binding protein